MSWTQLQPNGIIIGKRGIALLLLLSMTTACFSFGDNPMYPCNHETCPILEIELIPLTKGKYTIVDKDVFEFLSSYKWYAQTTSYGFYMAGRREPKELNEDMVLMHRQIMGLTKGDKNVVDHINHISYDNRRINLRVCTRQKNNWNTTPRKVGTSKYKGVYYRKDRKKWTSRINKDEKPYRLGDFENEIDAAIAYNHKAIELFGKFSCLNKIQDEKNGRQT